MASSWSLTRGVGLAVAFSGALTGAVLLYLSPRTPESEPPSPSELTPAPGAGAPTAPELALVPATGEPEPPIPGNAGAPDAVTVETPELKVVRELQRLVAMLRARAGALDLRSAERAEVERIFEELLRGLRTLEETAPGLPRREARRLLEALVGEARDSLGEVLDPLERAELALPLLSESRERPSLLDVANQASRFTESAVVELGLRDEQAARFREISGNLQDRLEQVESGRDPEVPPDTLRAELVRESEAELAELLGPDLFDDYLEHRDEWRARWLAQIAPTAPVFLQHSSAETSMPAPTAPHDLSRKP